MSVRLRHLNVILLALLLGACATLEPEPGTHWLRLVDAIASGASTEARGRAITDRLDALGIRWQAHAFTTETHGDGHNLLADLGGTGPLLLIGAHYDRVAVGAGVTDNASGSAVVLELAAALSRRPLQNHRVMLAFWDHEENGLLGSKAWVKDNPGASELYVNFDVFGWGDTVWAMAPGSAAAMADALRSAAAAGGRAVSIGEQYPPTDHLSFLQAKQPAVSLSLVAGEEIPQILSAFSGNAPTPLPKVMQVIHSANDRLDQVDDAAVRAALPVVLDALRRWDVEHPGASEHNLEP